MGQQRRNGEVLRENVRLANRRVLDVGSGDGTLVRYMTRHGAHATGIECTPAQLEKARAVEPAGEEDYVEGVGQDLPWDADTFDAVVFFNSLHHVPVDAQETALREAARVVKPGGIVYVAEPIARGTGFEVHKPVDDETEVRAAAYAAIGRVAGDVLTPVREIEYDTVYHYARFEDMRDETVRIDARRAAAFEVNEDRLRQLFEQLGERDDEGWAFHQPMRVNILKKDEA